MAVLESVLVALGLGVAKYLAKEALPKDWQDQVAAELIGAAAKELSKQKEIEPVAAAIGEPLKVLYQHSTLNDNEKNAAQLEVIRTLAQADTSAARLVELDLDAAAFGRALIAARPEAQGQLSSGGRALYERMLAEAGQAIMKVANRVEGFEVAATRAQLGRQRLTLELLATLAPQPGELAAGAGRPSPTIRTHVPHRGRPQVEQDGAIRYRRKVSLGRHAQTLRYLCTARPAADCTVS